MTLTLAAVFAPLAFATGRTGRLFIEFCAGAGGRRGVGLGGADAVADDVLDVADASDPALKNLQLDRGRFNAFTRGYKRLLNIALAGNRLIVVLVALIVAGGAGLLFKMTKTELSPLEDRGVIFGFVGAGRLDVRLSDEVCAADRRASTNAARNQRLRRQRRLPERCRWHRAAAPEGLERPQPLAGGCGEGADAQIPGHRRCPGLPRRSRVARAEPAREAD